MLKNKKARYFITMVAIFLIIALAVMLAFIIKTSNKSSRQGEIGHKAALLVSSYQDAEKTLFYIDMASKYAAMDAYFLTGYYGAMPSDSDCGRYYNFAIWDFEDENCLPLKQSPPHVNVKALFEEKMNSAVNLFFELEQDLNIPKDNYNVNIFEEGFRLRVSGDAINPLSFEVTKYDAKSGYSTYTPINLPSAPASKGEKEMVRWIYEQYGQFISRYVQLYGFPPEYEALIAGMIAQESGGNPYALGFDLGSVGLTQFIDGTARSEQFSEIFEGKITSCNCGSKKVNKKRVCIMGGCCPAAGWKPGSWVPCNPGNDARFDPEKNIHGGVRYVHDNYVEIKRLFEEKFGAGNVNEETVIYSAIMGHNRGLGSVKSGSGVLGDIMQAGIENANSPGGWKIVARTGTSSYGRDYPYKVLKYASIYNEIKTGTLNDQQIG